MFQENYWASLKVDILGISPGAVWSHTPTTAIASGREKNRKLHPMKHEMHTGRYSDLTSNLSDLTSKTTTYSRQTSHKSDVHIHILGYKVKSLTLLKRIKLQKLYVAVQAIYGEWNCDCFIVSVPVPVGTGIRTPVSPVGHSNHSATVPYELLIAIICNIRMKSLWLEA